MKLNFRKAMLCLALMTSISFAATAECVCRHGQGITYTEHTFDGTCANITGKYATKVTMRFNAAGRLEKQVTVLSVSDTLNDLVGSSCI